LKICGLEYKVNKVNPEKENNIVVQIKLEDV